MSEPYVGEIRMFAGNFAPRGYASCDGQLLAISQNDALFSLLGTIYGGDGRTTFGLPDLRGRLPIHVGQGPGLSSRPIGQRSGAENVTLTTAGLPAHTHATSVSTEAGTQTNPSGAQLAASPTVRVFSPLPASLAMDSAAVTSVGGGQQHNNVMPYTCITFIIALVGIYPSRN
jgi:microcystin-dependent protein